MALVLYSLSILWFHMMGHSHVTFPDRPWYQRKTEPSFADILSTLRYESWLEQKRHVHSKSGLLKKFLPQLLRFVSRAG
jgi:hypothetical protein